MTAVHFPRDDRRGDVDELSQTYTHAGLPTLSRVEAPQTAEEAHSEQKRGVVAAARIRSVITQKDIHIAYAALTLVALVYAFQTFTQGPYVAYATSSFRTHSQLATARVVQGVFAMTSFAIVPKLLDNISRISPLIFLSMMLIIAIGDSMMAGSANVHTYIGASVFGGLGGTAYELSTQIYIAETTNIVSRAFWNVALDAVSSIIALYAGAEIAGAVLRDFGQENGWRWGYGMWVIIEVVSVIPFVCILFSWQRRVRVVEARDSLPALPPYRSVLVQLFHDYDIVGSVTFVGGLALILVPLSIAGGRAELWTGENIGMICAGGALIVLFVVWSLPTTYRPRGLFQPEFPLIPWHILKNSSVMAMFIVNLFDFMSYGMFSIYFQSYLQVASRFSAAQAAQIDNTVRVVFQVVAMATGLLMRFWTPLCKRLGLGERRFHTRWPISLGIPLCTLAMGLEINFVQNPLRSSAVAQFVIARGIYGLGRGMFQTTSQVSIQAAAKRGELTIATGIFYLAMSLGGSIGQAGAAAIWTSKLPGALARLLPAESKNQAGAIFGSIVTAMRYDPSTSTGAAVIASYVETMKIIAIAATCLQIPMLISMWFVKSIKLTEDEQVTVGGKRLALDKRTDADSSAGAGAGRAGAGAEAPEPETPMAEKYDEPATAVHSRDEKA